MKVRLTFKSPDVLDQVDDQIEDEECREIMKKACNSFLEYSEYITVEIETKDGEQPTAKVI